MRKTETPMDFVNPDRDIICDIDGTIADISHRLHFIEGENKDWDAFFKACPDDKPHQDVIDLLWATFTFSRNLHYFSGRSDMVRRETENWLGDNRVPLGALHMRKSGDHRPDHEIKAEMIAELDLRPADVWFILDDRDQVVNMWRSKGFRVLQVADGRF